MASSTWPAEALTAYLAERFPVRVWGALAILLAVAAEAASGLDPLRIAVGAALTLPMLLQFRIHDDLSDRERDRTRAPHRVLVTAQTVGPFIGLAAALFALNLLLLSLRTRRPWAPVALAAFSAGLAAWYARLRRWRRSPLAHHVPLLKYPMCTWLVSSVEPGRAAMVTAPWVYLAVCVHEVAHDPRLRRSRRAVRVARFESVLLSLLPGVVTLAVAGRGWPAARQAVLGLALFVVVRRLLGPGRSAEGWRGPALFLIVLLQLLSFGMILSRGAGRP